MKRPVYVATNMDVWEHWLPSTQHQRVRPPLWVSKTCWYDLVVRPYYLLTPKTLAWFWQSLRKIYAQDRERWNRLNFCADPNKPIGFVRVLAIAEEIFTEEECLWAEQTTDAITLPHVPCLVVDEEGHPKKQVPATPEEVARRLAWKPFYTDNPPSPLASGQSPPATIIGTSENAALLTLYPDYSSTSGKIIFSRHYPSTSKPWTPTEIKEAMRRRNVAGIRRRKKKKWEGI